MLYIVTRRSGFGNGSGFRITAFSTVKITVFAPMHSARVSSAVSEQLESESQILQHTEDYYAPPRGRIANYSARNVIAGSMRAALRSGPKPASNAAASNTTGAVTSTTASRLVTPYRRLRSDRATGLVFAGLAMTLSAIGIYA